jgi:hypothetical protein
VRSVKARVGRKADGVLTITYSISGDLSRVRVPPPREPRIAHGLWQRTCCECFIARDGEPGYHEFNFSPSGEWAAYAFAKYREGEAVVDEKLDPRIALQRPAGTLELDASIALGRLSERHAREKLAVALSAVIEDDEGTLSYWALRHPAGKPDFHHRDSFILQLEPAADTRR